MKVTNVWVTPLKNSSGKLFGYADITLDNIITLRGFKLWNNDDGSIGVQFPKQQAKNGEWYPTMYLKKVSKESDELVPEAQALLAEIKEEVQKKVSNSSRPANTQSHSTPNLEEDDLPF